MLIQKVDSVMEASYGASLRFLKGGSLEDLAFPIKLHLFERLLNVILFSSSLAHVFADLSVLYHSHIHEF